MSTETGYLTWIMTIQRVLVHVYYLVSHFYSRFVERSIFGIVSHTIVYNKIEVMIKLIHVSVMMTIYLFPHRLEIHWGVNKIIVIRCLQNE